MRRGVSVTLSYQDDGRTLKVFVKERSKKNDLGRALIKRGARGGLMPAERTRGNSLRACRSDLRCVDNV
jgi:hypothetical protein